MSKIVVMDDECITIECFPEKGLIYHTIHKPISGQPFRDALNAGTEMFIKHGAYKWLSDDRKNGPITVEDAEWGFNNWNLRMIEAGWKYWGLVVPTDKVGAGSLIHTVMDLSERGLRVMVSDNLEEAMEWLDSF
jgi:hypothetical protein